MSSQTQIADELLAKRLQQEEYDHQKRLQTLQDEEFARFI
jgi:hypothetical protein